MSTENEQTTSNNSSSETTPNSEATSSTEESQTSSSDLLSGDDTAEASGNDTASDDLLSGDESASESAFDITEVTADDFKSQFEGENDWNDEQLSEFLSVINSAESRADLAKQMLELHERIIADGAETAAAQFQETVKSWQDETRAHKTLGGDKLDESLAKVKTFINDYSENPTATLAIFKATGMSNNIHLIQLLHAAAEAVPGEARPAEGAPASQGASIADRMFPSTAQSQT